MFASQMKETSRRSGTSAMSIAAPNAGIRFVDASGYAVFSNDDDGTAHVMAHRMLDEGRLAEGHQWLGRWLEGRHGHGPRWVHLQWHLAVFEVALGFWEDALSRLRGHILPVVSAGEALTDAPALLWRLELARPGAFDLPWDAVRGAAAERLGTDTAYVELHNLLALAGARDVSGLEDWLAAKTSRLFPSARELLSSWAEGLRAYAAGDFSLAARLLEPAVPGVQRIGGSKAQNELFADIWNDAQRRSTNARTPRSRGLASRRPTISQAVSWR